MKPKWPFILLAVLAVSVGAWLWFGGQPNKNDAGKGPTNIASLSAGASDFDKAVLVAANGLVSAKTARERYVALDSLQHQLTYGTSNQISAVIRRLLDSKLDGPTGQGFKIGNGGALLETPTLRSYLLDELAKCDPAAAAAYARNILNDSASPDEWAVALRNLARGDNSADARALLTAKTGELLRNESWQQSPAISYLEAFDTAVYLGGTNLLPPLSDLVRKQDNQAVAHAAFLTLDRLVINQPAEILSELEQHPDWMQGREQTRADYFARADVGDPAQRNIVEAYLLDSTRTPAELQAFAGVFPNANFMISPNLLTGNPTLDGGALRRRDRASLEAVNQWLGDPRFAALKPQLIVIQQRLQGFVNQGQ